MAAGDRYIPTAGGTLFHLAAQHLGVAEHWTRIAAANGMDDPWLSDVRTVLVPRRDPYADRSGILYPTFRIRPTPALRPDPVAAPDPVPDTPPVPQPPVRSFRFDRMAGPFRFDATGPDAPTFDQVGLLAPPVDGGGGFPGPVDPPPVDPPPVEPLPVLWTFDAASGVTFDAAVGYTFDEGPPETVQTITFDKTTGTGFDATTGPGFDQG